MSKRRQPLEGLIFDDAIWPRLALDSTRVEYLADVLRAGQELPPIKVQKGTGLVLGGRHTVLACRLLGESTYFVETVDVADEERLLFAYREDLAAALPYSDADTKSVAERLYRQRMNGTGQAPNVAQIARDLGRAQQTVDAWLKDLIEVERQRQDRERHARALVVTMLAKGSHVSQRRIAELLGVSLGTVSSDTGSGIAEHALADDRIVSLARSILAETAGRGSTDAERQTAADWLLDQVNPDALATARRLRALTQVLTWTGASRRQLGQLETQDLAGCGASRDLNVQHKREALLADLYAIQNAVSEIERRMT